MSRYYLQEFTQRLTHGTFPYGTLAVNVLGSLVVGFVGERPVGDNRPIAAATQASIQRGLSGSQRLAVACDMSQIARALALTRLRSQHPEWSDLEVKRELLRYAFLPGPLPPPLR